MKSSNRVTLTSSIIITLLLGFALFQVSSAQTEITFTPRVGLSQPFGDMEDTWKSGFHVGFDLYKNVDLPVEVGLRAVYHNWQVNSSKMFELDGREFKIEKSDGINHDIELSLQVKYPLLQDDRFWLEAAAGPVYFNNTDIEVVGFYPYGSSAVNRDIYIASESGFSGVFAVGIGSKISSNLQLSIVYRHSLYDLGGSTVLVSCGLLPMVK